MLVGRAFAMQEGRDYVTPEDVKAIAVSALSHRVTLQPENWMRGLSSAGVIRDVLDHVPVPAAAPETGSDRPITQSQQGRTAGAR
jgi:MoxR-like ATPase